MSFVYERDTIVDDRVFKCLCSLKLNVLVLAKPSVFTLTLTSEILESGNHCIVRSGTSHENVLLVPLLDWKACS